MTKREWRATWFGAGIAVVGSILFAVIAHALEPTINGPGTRNLAPPVLWGLGGAFGMGLGAFVASFGTRRFWPGAQAAFFGALAFLVLVILAYNDKTLRLEDQVVGSLIIVVVPAFLGGSRSPRSSASSAVGRSPRSASRRPPSRPTATASAGLSPPRVAASGHDGLAAWHNWRHHPSDHYGARPPTDEEHAMTMTDDPKTQELLISSDSHVKIGHDSVKQHLASKFHDAYDKAAERLHAADEHGRGRGEQGVGHVTQARAGHRARSVSATWRSPVTPTRRRASRRWTSTASRRKSSTAR